MSLFRRSRPCGTHDRATPRKTAQLERDTGIDPDAVDKLERGPGSFVDKYADPDIIDCGNRRCRQETEHTVIGRYAVPETDVLRAAGIEARLARMREELEAPLRATRRGRLILRLCSWYARRSNRR